MARKLFILGFAPLLVLGLAVNGCEKDKLPTSSIDVVVNDSVISASPEVQPADSLATELQAADSSDLEQSTQAAGSTVTSAMQLVNLKIDGISRNISTVMPAIRLREGDRVELRITINDAGQQTAVNAVDALGLVCAYIQLQPASGPQTFTYTTRADGTGVLHIRFVLGPTNFIVRFFVSGTTWANADVSGLRDVVGQAYVDEGLTANVTGVYIQNPAAPTKYFGFYRPPTLPGIIEVNRAEDVNESNCDAILYAAQFEESGLSWMDKGATIYDPQYLYKYPGLVVERAQTVCYEKHTHSTDFVENVAQYLEGQASDPVHMGMYVVAGGACIAAPVLVVPCAVLAKLAASDAAAALTQATVRTVINAHYQDLGWTPEYRNLVLGVAKYATIFGPKSKIPKPMDKRLNPISRDVLVARNVKDAIRYMRAINSGAQLARVALVNNTIIGDLPPEYNASIAIPIVLANAPVQNTPPTACFTYTPQAVTTATTITLSASCSSDLETALSALQVRWQIDGVWTAWTTSKTRVKRWTTAGQKAVVLEVKDAGGLTAQVTKVITVTAPSNTAPTIQVNCVSTGTAGTSITFSWTTHDAEGDAVRVAIDWMDGSQIQWVSGSSASHTYVNLGTYSPRFTAYDGKAWSQTFVCPITIAGGALPDPIAGIVQHPGSLLVNQAGTWVFTGDANCEYIAVAMGDNSAIKYFLAQELPRTFSYSYATAGTYEVRCTGYGNGKWGPTATRNVTVSNPPAATPIVFITTALPDALLNVPYTTRIMVSGGTPQCTVTQTVVSGMLPPGITLGSDGVFSGSANVYGSTYTFTVRAQDACDQMNYALREFTIVTTAGTGNLCVETQNAAGPIYRNGVLVGTGRWCGNVPAGVAQTIEFGDVAGFSKPSGRVVILQNGESVTVYGAYVANTGCGYVTIITDPYNGVAHVGQYWQGAIGVTSCGAWGPFRWSIVSGSIPSGTSFSTSTGYVVGTPIQVGTYRYIVRVQDNSPTPMWDEETLTVTVY